MLYGLVEFDTLQVMESVDAEEIRACGVQGHEHGAYPATPLSRASITAFATTSNLITPISHYVKPEYGWSIILDNWFIRVRNQMISYSFCPCIDVILHSDTWAATDNSWCAWLGVMTRS